MDDLYSLYVHDYEHDIHIYGYTDCFVYDKSSFIHFISIGGFDSAVKGIRAAFMKGKKIYIGDYGDLYLPADNYHGYIAKTEGGYTHNILVSSNIYNPNSQSPVFLLWGNQSAEDALFYILSTRYSVPLKKDWSKWLYNYLRSKNYVEKLTVVGNKELKAFKVALSDEKLENIVCDAVKNKELIINGENKFDFANISMTDYLLQNGDYFAERINNLFKPLFNPLKDELNTYLRDLLVKPFRAQADVITASVLVLNNENSIIINGEMGTGKTLMGASIPYIYSEGKPKRVIVMCPGHLMEKWKREISNTIPNVRSYIIDDWKDVLKIKRSNAIKTKKGSRWRKPNSSEYYIISRDKAKLGYMYKPAIQYNKFKNVILCPNCGKELVDTVKGIPLTIQDFEKRRKNNSKCQHCNSPLWEADNKNLRRYAPAEYIKKHLKNFFDFFIADEVHELKGDTAQGRAFGVLSSVCKKTIALTGTLFGGYSSNLFYILFRLSPKSMKDEDLSYYSMQRWIERYGVIERTTKEKYDTELNKASKGNKSRVNVKEKPGVSPLVFSKHLINKCIFLELSDLQQVLPKYDEYIVDVNMDEELEDAYTVLNYEISEVMKELLRRGSKRMLGTYLQTLLSYPDRPFDNFPIYTKDELGEPIYVTTPIELDKNKIYNKEKKLIEMIKSELEENRNVFVFATYTGKKDITKRLQGLLLKSNIKAEILKTSIEPAKREEWISNKIKSGVKVIISNPELVKTGLDMYDFPTIIFYQTGYNLFTLRQASRRSWRIGQTRPVRVMYMVYNNTLQYNALTLMSSKLDAAMSLEGKFSEEGLRSLADTNDLTSELAKSLVNGLNTSFNIESMWKTLDSIKRDDILEFSQKPAIIVQSNDISHAVGQIDIFSMAKEETNTIKIEYKAVTKKVKKSKVTTGQLALFDI